MDFEWDSDKDEENQRKHGVAHTERDGRVRIISARDVTAAERRTYEEDDEKPGR